MIVELPDPGHVTILTLPQLNPVPIRLIYDRWLGKYRDRQVTALPPARGRS
jgi:hypothetical protein